MFSNKIIFQTWKNKDIPKQWQDNQRSIIEKNPGWSYRLLTDEDNDAIVAKYFPTFLKTFRGYKHAIQRADAIRYIVLYLWG